MTATFPQEEALWRLLMHREYCIDYTFSQKEGVANKLEDLVYKQTHIPSGTSSNQLIYVKDKKRLVALLGHWNRSTTLWKYELIG
jgi:hypothetical protein